MALEAPPERGLNQTSSTIDESHLMVQVGAKTEQGKRANNEDSLFTSQEQGIYIVADGMGGQEDGEVASGLATELIPHHYQLELKKFHNPVIAIQKAVEIANQTIVAAGDSQDAHRRMGTTAVVAVHHQKKVYVGGIGDSRVYLVRSGEIRQLTVDHTLADALQRNGDLSEEQAANSPWRHVLYKFLGCPDLKEKIDVCSFVPRPGDRLVLASDGITNYVDADDLIDGARDFSDPQEWAASMIHVSLERGSRDNLTCIVLAFERSEE